MHIQNRTAMVTFDFIIGILAGLATWIQLASFGDNAWRLFATWVALVAAIYYIVDALFALLAKRRPIGAEVCPMLQGGLIVSGVLLFLIRIVYYVLDSYIPSVGVNVILIEFILPILMIMSWVMFSVKGKWRAYEPFYWLALPVVYVALILVSGELMPRSASLVYPYEFLDYPSIGIDTMLWWFAIFATAVLIVGYIFWILDFALSGKLAEHIVMPKIKTVVIEEEVEDEEPEVIEKPKEKPVKLVTTGSRNLPVIEAQQAAKRTKNTQAKPKTPTNDEKSSKTVETKPQVTNAKKTKQTEAKPEASDKTKPRELGIKKPKAVSATDDKPKVNDKVKPSASAGETSKPKPPAKAEENKPASTPPVRIIEKIDLTGDKGNEEKTESAKKPSMKQEVVIKDGQKTVVTKPISEPKAQAQDNAKNTAKKAEDEPKAGQKVTS